MLDNEAGAILHYIVDFLESGDVRVADFLQEESHHGHAVVPVFQQILEGSHILLDLLHPKYYKNCHPHSLTSKV